jgi:tetratricopeptide (TPR) repeat protein
MTPSNRRLTQACCGLLVLVAFSTVTIVTAQESGEPKPKSLYDQLHERAKSAETVPELTELVQQMSEILSRDTSEDMKPYVTELLAWTLNRRGEAYTRQAAAKAEKNDQEAAEELDRLALRDYEKSIELDPQRWKSLHNRGVCLALKGQFTDALRDFSRVIELQNDYADAWFNRGEIHYELGHFDKAVADYDKAIELAPDAASMYTARGHANFQLRRFEEALADYSQVVKLAPKNAEAYADRGDAYRSLGRWEEAATDFRQAVRLDNKLPHALQSAAWFVATCPDDRFRNAKLAVQAAQRAVELRGEADYIYLDTLAAAYAENGDFERAQETLRRAIELAPQDNVKPLEHRLNLYQAQKPYRQAVVKELR